MTNPILPKHYTATALGGWMLVILADNARDAQRIARGQAQGVSLLPSDVDPIRLSTPAEVAWYEAQSGHDAS